MSNNISADEPRDGKLLVTLVAPARQRQKKQLARRKKARDWKVQVYDSSEKTALNVVLSGKITTS